MKILFLFLALTALTCELFSQNMDNKHGWRRLLANFTYDVSVNTLNHNTIHVGGQGRRSFTSYDGGKTWTMYPMGEVTASSAQMNNVLTSTIDTNIIISGGLLAQDVYRSADGGKTWSIVNHNSTLNGKALIEDIADPHKFLYAEYNSGVIYESKDLGLTWDTLTRVYKPTVIVKPDGTKIDTTIYQNPTCLVQRPDSANILLSGNLGGHVLLSPDRGKTWLYTALLKTGTPALDNSDTELTMFYFDKNSPLVGYISITYLLPKNTPNGGIWKTEDGGYHWKPFAFPDSSFWAVACRTTPKGNHEVFVGGYTEDMSSVYSGAVPGNKIVRGTYDGGKTWWAYDSQISWYDANPYINSLSYKDKKLYSSEFGGNLISYTFGSNPGAQMEVFAKKEKINELCALGGDRVIMACTNGMIYGNLEKKLIWDSIAKVSDYNVNSIVNMPEEFYIAVGDNGGIYRSAYGYKNWKSINSDIKVNLTSIAKIDATSLFAVGEKGSAIISSDKGGTWKTLSFTNKDLHKTYFPTSTVGYLVGDDGLIMKSSNGGQVWDKLNSGVTDTLRSVFFIDSLNGFVVGLKNTILKTNNGGKDWTKLNAPIDMNWSDVKMISSDTIIVSGESRSLLFSYDGGNTWIVRTSAYGPTANMWSMRYFGDPGNEKLYMATEAGLFVLENLESSVEEIKAQDPSSNLNIAVEKSQIAIVYERAYKDENFPITMRIVDVSGNVVFSKKYNLFHNENIFDTFETSYLSNGAYFVDFIEKDKRITKGFVKK
jgi:photosystem II stability/assembly factor-like uncharacterized protein